MTQFTATDTGSDKERGMKFKTIATRIWVTFTTVILVTVSLILVVYYGVFNFVDSEAKEKDILILHETILEGNYSPKVQFDTFHNLRNSNNYLVKDGKVYSFMEYIARRSDVVMPHMPRFPRGEQLEESLSDVANEGDYKRIIKRKILGRRYIIVSSEYDGGFLLSTVPLNINGGILYMLLGMGVFFIIIGFIVSRIIAYYVAKPLRQLEGFTKRVAVKDFSKPVCVSSRDELGRLAESMNMMQESLKRADEEEKLFLQSISHDLKTPVMVIMSHADAIIDGIYVDSLPNTARIIRDEAVALNKKVRGLLYLNTLDYVLENKAENDIVDVGEIISNIVSRLRHVRENIEFDLSIEKAEITADSEKLTVAFENIIDNAIRYAKSKIHVTVNKQDEHIRAIIFNDGEPIKLKKVEMVFEKMYKDKKGNFGLGLAITKKIIEFYKGSIIAENTDGGVEFTVIL